MINKSLFNQEVENEDRLSIEGFLSIEAFRDGKKIYNFHEKNIMLQLGKHEIMKILRNNTARETNSVVRSICRFAIGDGGASPSFLYQPKPLDSERSSLFSEVHRKDVGSTSHPEGHIIEFVTGFDSNDFSVSDFNAANGGTYINEAALISSIPGEYNAGNPGDAGVVGPDDILINHKTFPSIPFTPGLGVLAVFKWRLHIIL